MPLFYKGQSVKSIRIVTDGKTKLFVRAKDYPGLNEGHYEMVGDNRIEVKEYKVTRRTKKLKSIGTFSFDDMIVDYFL